MTPIYHNLSQSEALFAAKLAVGGEMVFVRPLDEQPTEKEVIWLCENEIRYVVSVPVSNLLYKDRINRTGCLHFPIGLTVLMRECWAYRKHETGYWYKIDWFVEGDYIPNVTWLASTCMPPDAIRREGTVIDDRMCQISDINIKLFEPLFKNSQDPVYDYVTYFRKYIERVCGKSAWERNLWCEVVTVRKER